MVTLNLQLFNNNKPLGNDTRNDEREVKMGKGIPLRQYHVRQILP